MKKSSMLPPSWLNSMRSEKLTRLISRDMNDGFGDAYCTTAFAIPVMAMRILSIRGSVRQPPPVP